MRRIFVSFALIAVLYLFSQEAHATMLFVDDFTDLPNAVFIDVPSGNVLQPITSNSFTITANPTFVNLSFAAWPIGTVENPGNGDGYGFYSRGLNSPPLILNFLEPVYGFGVSFFHMTPDRVEGNLATSAILELFDNINGTGAKLASFSSSGFDSSLQLSGHQDFIAGLSDDSNIRSAVLYGAGEKLGFGVDGYGYTLSNSTIPEPATMALFGMGLAGAMVRRRKKG